MKPFMTILASSEIILNLAWEILLRLVLYNCIEWGDAIIVEGTRIEKRRRDVKLALNLFVITILRYCFSV